MEKFWESSSNQSKPTCPAGVETNITGLFPPHPAMCRPTVFNGFNKITEKKEAKSPDTLNSKLFAATLCVACIATNLWPEPIIIERQETTEIATEKKKETPKKRAKTGVSLFGPDANAVAPKVAKEENEAAPITHRQLTTDIAMAYIDKYEEVARQEMQYYGILASISLAQGLIESRAGDSKLARSNNNHFGMKCFSQKCKKGHCSNFTDDTHKDFFLKFPSAWHSWRKHSELLSSKHYAPLKRCGKDYKKWAYGLKAAGYATDKNYAKKLIDIIEEYELYKIDK